MITTKIILIILVIHFIADQLLQIPLIVKNKDNNTAFMLGHIATWGIAMWILTMIFCYKLQNWEMMKWFVFMMAVHFFVEWPLSRASSALQHRKNFVGANIVNMLEALIINVMLIVSFMYFMFG